MNVSTQDKVTIAPEEFAATVILLRDAAKGMETLMLRRNSKLNFAGGLWVFPGGRIDDEDRSGSETEEERDAAALCAVREAQEEAALEVDPAALVPFSHWTPPDEAPRRFLTWFFLAPAPVGEVAIDQGEIHDHRWVTPTEGLRRVRENDIQVLPPTLVTLSELECFERVEDALAHFGTREPEFFRTRIGRDPAGPTALWEGDAGYEASDPSVAGPRHRLVMAEGHWRYDRDEETRR